MLLGHTQIGILFHLNIPVRLADRNGVVIAVLHHNALDYGLTTNS